MISPTDARPRPAYTCDPFAELPRPVVLRLLAGPGKFTKADYRQYLTTTWWQTVKAAALELWGRSCALCGSPLGLQVHHRGREAYRHLFREIVARHLTVLCSRCHEAHHRHTRRR